MATRYNYTGGIVTNGLVLNLDAAKTDSYPGTGTTWRDLSGFGNNGTLTNGPTFSGIGKQASIVFDGTNDFVLVNSGSTSINPTTAITVSSFFNISSYSNNYAPIVFKQNNFAGFFEQYVLVLLNTGILFVVTGIDRTQKIAQIPGDFRNQTVYAVGTCNTVTDELKIYFNGILVQTVPFTSTFDIADTPINIGGSGVLKFGATFPGFANGKIHNTSIYNRALSAQEVLQNFNALRGRYGI